jgi:hypothetical protein
MRLRPFVILFFAVIAAALALGIGALSADGAVRVRILLGDEGG